MSWSYKEALFYGNKTNPVAGDSVTVVLETDDEKPESRELIYGFDGGKSKAEFVAMVKAEVRAHLQHLNKVAAGEDVSDVFEPV